MSAPDAGRVLRRALLAWGLGHLMLGRVAVGRALLAAQVLAIIGLAWLTIGLADSSLYLVPFLAGMAFIATWAWQAVDAYRSARRTDPDTAPARSPAPAMGWLTLPLLVWGAGFWLVAAHSANPEAVLDRFMRDWSRSELASAWPDAVTDGAQAAADALGTGPERFRDVRIRLVDRSSAQATAVAEAIHFERRDTTLLGIFPGTELVPVADRQVLRLRLVAAPVELPGGGDVGAVRWTLVETEPAP